MGFLKKMFGGAALDGEKMAQSTVKGEYAQIELLGAFDPPRALHTSGERQRWSRALPHPYDETLTIFEKQGWLERRTDAGGELRAVTATGAPIVAHYRARLQAEKEAVMPRVRQALEAKDTSGAFDLRREYEARQPLGEANWTGPEPQMNHSALTRQILFLNHWLLDGLGAETLAWLRLYAAEQYLWGTTWRLPAEQIPESVRTELTTPAMDGPETAFWKACQLSLYVDNHELWLRCKGGDHVRRLEIAGPSAEITCDACRAILGKQYLVARAPELPLRDCQCLHGCLCRYEPVIEMEG